MNKKIVQYSKFLSLVLRHDPGKVEIELDEAGWVDVDILLPALQKKKPGYTREMLEEVVATNDKKRFVFSEDGKRIRASQGHSVAVELNLPPASPPAILYHGTPDRNIDSIRNQGLLKGKRHHVHRSADEETARRVGMRFGRPVVLTIDAARMAEAGFTFHVSENGVWLVESIPPEYISFPV